MVGGQGQAHESLEHDLPFPLHRFQLNRTRSQDGHLGLIEDRGEVLDPQGAHVGNGESPSVQLIRGHGIFQAGPA